MKRPLASLLICALLGFVAAAQAADEEKIGIKFKNTKVLDVLEFYAKLTGKIFIPADELDGKITVITPGPVTKDQAVRLLYSILDMRGFAVVEVDGYYKIVKRKAALDATSAAFEVGGAGDRLVTDVIVTRYLDVDAAAENFRTLISEDGKLVANKAMNALLVTDSAANIEKLRQYIEKIDTPLTLPVSRSYDLQYLSVTSIQPLLENLLTQDEGADSDSLGRRRASVLADERSNTLIVTATLPQQEQVKEIIEKLDERSAQVMLEAKIVEVSLTQKNKFGVEWQKFLSGGSNRFGFGLLAEDAALATDMTLSRLGVNAGLLDPEEYAAMINLLTTDTSARILSAPHLMASDNQEASLRIGDEIPVVKEIRLDDNNRNITTYGREKVGLEIIITPSIANNRDVSLDLDFTNSSVQSGDPTTGEQYTISERQVKTNIVVKDKQTLVISGLMRDDLNTSSYGVPKMRDMPFLGKLFGSEEDDTTNKELLILITPYVVQNEREAIEVGDAQLRKHPTAVRAGALGERATEFDL